MSHSPDSRRERISWTADLPASIVVFLVALPLCMGVAIASGAPVTAGLVTGIVGGIVAGALAGSPLQVSGPAAGLTVLTFQCVQTHGIEMLGVIVLLAGAVQLLLGVLKLGQWFRAVSPAVILGMLAGIGVLIFAGQFHVMVDDRPKATGIANVLTIPESIAKAVPLPWPELEKEAATGDRTRLLREASMLHLRAVELDDSVHRVLTGLVPHDADNQKPGADQVHNDVEQPLAEELAAARLQSLAEPLSKIVDEIDRFGGSHDSEAWRAARIASHEALADLVNGNVRTSRIAMGRAVVALADLRDSLKSHHWAALIGIATIATILFWQAFVARRLKALPAPLVAVGLATLLTIALRLPILYVEVPDRLIDEIHFPSLAQLKGLLDPSVAMMALQIAIIASAETLLCATAVDQMHQGPRTKYDRELASQGVGNLVCGLLGAMPMTGVIVRSSANVQAGAKSRLSAVLHGVWILIFVVFLSWMLRLIPTAALAAVLVFTGYKLVNVKAIKSLRKYGNSEVVIYFATMVTIVSTDLLTGVLTGIGLSLAKLLYTFSHLKIRVAADPEHGRHTLFLEGSATFLRLPKLAAALEEVPPETELHVHLEGLNYIDHACLDLLMNWEKQHESSGGRLLVDWESLTARFRTPPTIAPEPSEPEVLPRRQAAG